MPSVFLSYRRADSPDTVKLLHERLKVRLPRWEIFYDHENIAPGEKFPDRLHSEVSQATVVLVIIGPQWAEQLRQRQHEPVDHVRSEVELALQAPNKVLPVLINRAALPRAGDLGSLQPLLEHNTKPLRPDPDFDSDLEVLVNHLKQLGGSEAVGTILADRYTLTDKIGEGGMGVVFLAEQKQPVQRTVAVKLIKPGMDSREVLARFDAERQALAVMDHANVAKVLDGGLTPSGRPFFVMEYVKGVPITDFCDAKKLTPRERLELFIPVCNAVQHAHQKGIIHRDIKPSNVLVEISDGKAVPKVIDFGLAKALGHKLTDMTLHTAFDTRVGTLEYSSPEQAAGRAFEVDTRTDIYSLGALLYELLTGAPPFTREELLKAGEDRMRQMIREVEPVKPSKKLSSSGELPAIAANRHLEPARLTRMVKGDLDWIVMKCLEKERGRRYETANQVGQELQRFLADEPVQAGPPSLGYWARKFLRRNKGPVLAATLVVTLTLLGVGGFLWQRQRSEEHKMQLEALQRAEAEKAQQDAVAKQVKVEYYANCINRWGVLDGVGRLTEEQARHRSTTWKVYRRGGRVERTDVVKGGGSFQAFSGISTFIDGMTGGADEKKRSCRHEYKYDQTGHISEGVAYDHAGAVVYVFHFTSPTLAHYADERGYATPHAPSGATYVEFVRSRDGLDLEARYRDRQGFAKPNRDGVYGQKTEHDARGLPVKITYLDARDQPMANTLGFAKCVFAYNDLGYCTETTYLGVDDQPVRNKWGYVKMTAVYDQYGNQVERACLGPDGKLTLDRNGLAKLTEKFDDHGNLVEAVFFGLDGQWARNEDGYAKTARRFDDHGNLTEMAFFGPDGRPTVNKFGGIARMALNHDQSGRVIEYVYFGLDGKLTRHSKDGNARLTIKYDAHGNPTERAFFAPDGKPCLNRSGFATEKVAFNDRREPIQKTFFGIDGQPTRSVEGYHKLISTFDGNGLRTEQSCFGPDGKLTRNLQGFAVIIFKHDGDGNITEQAYFDPERRPTLHKDGNAKVTWAYDNRGNKVEAVYYGPDGKWIRESNGIARVTQKYDDRGNVTEKAYFGPDGQPTLHKDGSAKIIISYDDRGKPIQQAFFDNDGKPTRSVDGYHRLVSTFDKNGLTTEQTCYGPDGQLTRNESCVAILKLKHDLDGNVTEQEFFDPERRPTLHKDGYSKITMSYDNRRNKIETVYFGVDGKWTRDANGVARWTNKYNDRGNRTEAAFFGPDGKPTMHKDGNSKALYSYNDRGQLIKETFLGLDEKPIRLKNGYASTTTGYDERGNRIARAYFDAEDRPTLNQQGFARITWVCDDRGHDIEEAYFGKDDKPGRAKSVARVAWKYDDRGRKIEQAHLDPDGQPMKHAFKWAYDDRGNRTEEAYFDVAGNRIPGKSGWARIAWRYDERGRKIESAVYTADDKLFLDPSNNVPITKWKYDERGNTAEEGYFGLDGKPTRNITNDVAGVSYRYDDRGNNIEKVYFGVDGEVTANKGGWAWWKWRYDDRGNRIEEAYFDVLGQPFVDPKDPYSKCTMKYDERGNKTEWAFFDVDGMPTLQKGGYAKIIYRYDGNGYTIGASHFLDVQGRKVTTEVVVMKIKPGTQAARIGMKVGDVLVSYDGQAVTDIWSLLQRRKTEGDGDSARFLVVRREGKVLPPLPIMPGTIGVYWEDKAVPPTNTPPNHATTP